MRLTTMRAIVAGATAGLSLGASGATEQEPPLLVGKAMPPIGEDAHWLKGDGESVAKFHKGTVYILEFWATW